MLVTAEIIDKIGQDVQSAYPARNPWGLLPRIISELSQQSASDQVQSAYCALLSQPVEAGATLLDELDVPALGSSDGTVQWGAMVSAAKQVGAELTAHRQALKADGSAALNNPDLVAAWVQSMEETVASHFGGEYPEGINNLPGLMFGRMMSSPGQREKLDQVCKLLDARLD